LTFGFDFRTKKLSKKYYLWSKKNLFCQINFSRTFFSISQKIFFSNWKKRSPFLLSSKKNYILISKIFGQVKSKEPFFKKEEYKKFSENYLLKNLIRFSKSGKTENYSDLGKFKN